MVRNFPGPYEIEILYTVAGLEHSQKLNCFVDGAPLPGTPIASISLNRRDFTLININAAVLEWIALIKVLFNVAATFDSYTLWQYTPLSFTKVFIAANVLGILGTDASVSQQAHQLTMTHRTIEGGILRIVVLETTSTTLVRIPYTSAPPTGQAIMDYVITTDTWILGRDTSYAIAPLNYTGGENEAVFKVRYR
ncbi:hypothetical protein LCGC14_2226270 [marine sediment metagenome]|uniref:Uncharacterized protein n=1 Tax=marine sediment metagenome TaxID=412755 RepID=A0A0F9D9J8_9ZZZZ